MLKRIYEWYRIVDARPSSDIIERRKLAVADLIKRIDAASDYYLLLGCVDASVNGLKIGFSQDSNLVQAIVESIQAHQVAFPSDLSENEVELRACAAIALGEILTRDLLDKGAPKNDATLAAGFVVAGSGLRPTIKERHLRSLIDELNTAARATLVRAAVAKRNRPDLDMKLFEKIPVEPDLATFWKSLLPALRTTFSRLQQQIRADREELDVLWWLYNGFSDTQKKSLSSLSATEVALCCGIELGDLVIIPALDNVQQMVLQAFTKDRNKKTDLAEGSLAKLIEQCDIEVIKIVAPADNDVRQIVLDYPSVLPLSWLSMRIAESGVKSGWSDEFKAKTGLDPSQSYTPRTIAIQVFNERTVQRIYAYSV